ncbi:MAG: restriction endonuclease subunit S [Ignavibacteriaceae bacterium]|jgi:type I restriction enzyme S subunit|nr:restriction endonuclease subunit S [Ignavibacteriaceae bacterium]
MSNNWQYHKLDTLCTRIGDGLHGTPIYSNGTDYFFVNGNNLNNGKIELTNSVKTVTEEEFNKHYIELNENTLLLGINGSIGNMAFYNSEKVILGKSAAYLNFKTNINKFYYYYFQLKPIQKHFYNVATGSTIKNLSLQSLQELYVPVPVEKEHKKITAVLSSLDAKIELNNRINAELEAMAKTLYDYWFVQFDFPFDFAQGRPDKNGKPYKSSGGKMVWNEKLKREIPEGWDVKCLSEITDVATEQINPFENPEKDFNHYSIPAFDAFGTYIIEKGKEIQSNKFSIKKSDILVSKLNPWFNRVVYARDESDTISSTEFVVWRSSNESLKNYLYMIARDQPFISYCSLSATGTSNSHKRVNPDVMMKYKVPYNHDLSVLFGKIISPTIKKLSALIIENNELRNLRDWLLPMLMNDQVKVQ